MSRFQCPVFQKGEERTIKDGTRQPLKMARSCCIAILMNSLKSVELVSSLQHSAKNILEMLVIQHTSI